MVRLVMKNSSLMSKMLVLSFFLGMITIVSCKKKESPKAAAASFCINDSLMKQVKVDTVTLKPVVNELKLTGKITFNEDQVVKVFPFAGGVVEDLKVELGDFVEKGQTLALVRSGEIVDFENQLVSARSNLEVAKKNLQVADDLFKGNLTSEKELIAAKTQLQIAEGEFSRIKRILEFYGEGDQPAIYKVKAPISGYIVEKNITENTQFRVDNSENLFTISNLDKLWAIANVHESNISKIKLGQEAIVTAMAYQDNPYHGKVDKIFNVLDAETRVEKVKIEIKNDEHYLKPEMFAYILVRYPEGQDKLEIPSVGVIFSNNRNYVVVYRSPCDVEVREVEIYKSIKDRTFITSGLEKGEMILTAGHLLVFNTLTD